MKVNGDDSLKDRGQVFFKWIAVWWGTIKSAQLTE